MALLTKMRLGAWFAGVTLALTACAEGGSATTIGGGTIGSSDGMDDVTDETVGPDDGDDVEPDTTADTGDTDDDDGGSGACIMNNCSEDAHCDGCPDGANICDTDQGRCVQCDPENQVGCEDGEMCTEFGNCVPDGLECPTADGLPTIDCDTSDDCAACAPQFQTCHNGTCTECNDEDIGICQTVEHCVEGTCVRNCPESCTADGECSECGGDGHEAHACHNHACAQCSPTFPCPDGQTCTDEGICIDICGIPGQIPGTCEEDADCAGCPGDLTNCVAPINGGHGNCAPEAEGCSDLGSGTVVLPAPFDEVTNTCSDDGDCDGIGILYNVGELLRDITGIDSIDDANIEYPMPRCAEITVGSGSGSLSCGVCVPCEVDDDCTDIDIADVAGDAFGPLGVIATAILLDQLFGDQEQTIHMFCSPVGAGYGICAPCPNLLNDCAGPGTGGGGMGACDHDVCTEGGPLLPSCGSCAANVCASDPFCCGTAWDGLCVEHVEDECAGSCMGGGSGCDHGQCEQGGPLDPTCSGCVSAICSSDPFCCQTMWDSLCVDHVMDECGGDCGNGCSHSECETGAALADGCSQCVSDICDGDAFCCTTEWDSLCVSHTDEEANCSPCTSDCAHSPCSQGSPLENGCESCVSTVCGNDPFCCNTNWDAMCVTAAETACGC